MRGWYKDDDGSVMVSARVGNAPATTKQTPDPFAKKWEELKSLDGTTTSFKRRTTYKANNAGSKKLTEGNLYLTGYDVYDVMLPPYHLESLAQFYELSYANHTAIDTKVANIVGLGSHWEMSPSAIAKLSTKTTEEQVAAARRKVERVKMQLDEIFNQIVPDDTFIGVLEKVLTDIESTGNGYLEIGRKSNGAIGYIGHIPSTTIRVRRLRDGFVQIVGKDIVYFRNFQAKNTNPLTTDRKPNEIIHFKNYSPLNTYYGVPDAISVIDALNGDGYANKYNVDYFQNKAVPRYIVTLKGASLSPDSEEKLFKFLQTDLRNQNHRTLYIPLPSDSLGEKIEFDMKAIEAGIQDSSFEVYHKQNRNDVLMAHQVPLSKLGMAEGGFAGALASDRAFKEQVARPKQRMLEKLINKIVREFTDIVVFKLNELTLTDEQAEAQIYEKYVRNKIMVPNEVRNKLGLPPIPGGDKPVELTARQSSDARNEARGSDRRATDRENNQSDSAVSVSGRTATGDTNRGESA